MKFGTQVYVVRGSNNKPAHMRRRVRGKVVGAKACMVAVRLTRDDKEATYGPTKRNDVGWFGRKSVIPV